MPKDTVQGSRAFIWSEAAVYLPKRQREVVLLMRAQNPSICPASVPVCTDLYVCGHAVACVYVLD